jgi:hypothetical protein
MDDEDPICRICFEASGVNVAVAQQTIFTYGYVEFLWFQVQVLTATICFAHKE